MRFDKRDGHYVSIKRSNCSRHIGYRYRTKGGICGFLWRLEVRHCAVNESADLRGIAAGDKSWSTTIELAGAERCYIGQATDGKLNFYCIMKTFLHETDAQREFSILVSQIKSCAPEPPFNYRTKNTDTSTNFIVDLDHKTRAHASLIKVPGLPRLENIFTDNDVATYEWGVAVGVVGQ
jgi:hypothetical protein